MGILILMVIIYLVLVAGYVVTFRIQDARADDDYKGDKKKGLDKDFNRCILIAVLALVAMIVIVAVNWGNG